MQFLAVNSNCNDAPAVIAGHAKKYGLTFPVLRDAANVVADRFGAKRTPEVFVLDPDGRVVYRGRIDDQFGVGYKRDAPTRRDLAEALDEVLAGKPVSRPSTTPAGCFIARAVKPKADGTHHLRQGRVAHAATELPGVPPAGPGRTHAAVDL